MLNNGRRNVLVVFGVMLVTLAVIVGACPLVFGDYLVPAITGSAPYSYVCILVVVLALFIYFT